MWFSLFTSVSMLTPTPNPSSELFVQGKHTTFCDHTAIRTIEKKHETHELPAERLICAVENSGTIQGVDVDFKAIRWSTILLRTHMLRLLVPGELGASGHGRRDGRHFGGLLGRTTADARAQSPGQQAYRQRPQASRKGDHYGDCTKRGCWVGFEAFQIPAQMMAFFVAPKYFRLHRFRVVSICGRFRFVCAQGRAMEEPKGPIFRTLCE